MKQRAFLVVAVAAALCAVFPSLAGAAKVYLEDTLPKTGTTQVTVTVHKAAAFKVLLRTSTQGRTRLYLLGKTAPKGGALIDTKTTHCDGAAGSFYCKGSYEALPAGTYTFRIVFNRSTPQPANIELTVRW
jgi:hypothetical protein